MNNGRKTYDQIAGQSTHRIEAISDGVFAIALTLLCLDLKVPISTTINSEVQLFTSLVSLTPKFLSYFLSFMTLGIYWTGHSTQFHYIKKSDRHLNWISLFFLMFVTVLPFTTAFLSEYINFKLAIGLYWLNIFSLGLMLYLHWEYADRHNYIKISGYEKDLISHAIKERIIVSQTLYASGALLCFVNTYLSVIVIVLIQLNYALGLSHNSNKKT